MIGKLRNQFKRMGFNVTIWPITNGVEISYVGHGKELVRFGYSKNLSNDKIINDFVRKIIEAENELFKGG